MSDLPENNRWLWELAFQARMKNGYILAYRSTTNPRVAYGTLREGRQYTERWFVDGVPLSGGRAALDEALTEAQVTNLVPQFPLRDLVKEAKEEYGMRIGAYPKWVGQRKRNGKVFTEKEASLKIGRMAEIVRLLKIVAHFEPDPDDLFGALPFLGEKKDDVA